MHLQGRLLAKDIPTGPSSNRSGFDSDLSGSRHLGSSVLSQQHTRGFSDRAGTPSQAFSGIQSVGHADLLRSRPLGESFSVTMQKPSSQPVSAASWLSAAAPADDWTAALKAPFAPPPVPDLRPRSVRFDARAQSIQPPYSLPEDTSPRSGADGASVTTLGETWSLK